MTAIAARLVDKPWALPMVILAAAFVSAMLFWPPAAEPRRTVVKVCLNGALVLRTPDGEFRVMRPGALMDWPAIGPEVCQ